MPDYCKRKTGSCWKVRSIGEAMVRGSAGYFRRIYGKESKDCKRIIAMQIEEIQILQKHGRCRLLPMFQCHYEDIQEFLEEQDILQNDMRHLSLSCGQ